VVTASGTVLFLLLLIVEVSSVAVVDVATRVPKLILYRSQLDAIMHRGSLRLVRWWGVHRGLSVML